MAIGCATIGIFSVYLAVFSYLADTYHRYASSALAAQSFCKYLSYHLVTFLPFWLSYQLSFHPFKFRTVLAKHAHPQAGISPEASSHSSLTQCITG